MSLERTIALVVIGIVVAIAFALDSCKAKQRHHSRRTHECE